MIIRKKRIRNAARYMGGIPPGTELRPVVQITPTHRKKFQAIGFSDAPKNGDTILPAARGAVSRFNAEGKWVIHRDQPKENRYIRTVRWKWKQWRGRNSYEEHEDFRDIQKDCYPRTRVPPPGVELTYLEVEGEAYVVAPVFRNQPDDHEGICHAINLLLENFREAELTQSDLKKFQQVKLTRLNWKLLPQGAYPWKRLEDHLKSTLNRTSGNTQAVIMDRQKTIMSYKPAEQFIGLGGFSDYIAYTFPDHGLIVLECVRRGNAIYVFGKDWKRFAQLTKAEILKDNLHVARIIHSKGWKAALDQLLSLPNAAE